MSTPSETMFTATIQRSRPAPNARSLAAARASVCTTTTGERPVISLSTSATRRAWPPSAVTTRPPASRCPVARADLAEALVGGAQDPRQPVGELGGDRRAVAAAGLAAAQLAVGEGRLDDLVARLPGQHAVVGDEDDRAADPVAYRVGVRVAHVGQAHAAGVVAHAGDRAAVGPEGRAGQQQPARRGGERLREALAPSELVAEVVRLVGDDQRARAALRCPALGRGGDARVRRGDAVEVARRVQLLGVGRELDAEAPGDLGPLARQRRRRADDVDPGHDARVEQLAGEREAWDRLAGAGRGGQQERALVPLGQALEGALLPLPQDGQRTAGGAAATNTSGAVCGTRRTDRGSPANARRHGTCRGARGERPSFGQLSTRAGREAGALMFASERFRATLAASPDVRDRLDLDEHPRVDERGDRHHRRDRRVVGEALAVDAADLLGTAHVGDEHPRPHDLVHPRARQRQRRLDAVEHERRLGGGVADPVHDAVLVDRGRPRHEHDVARPHRRE